MCNNKIVILHFLSLFCLIDCSVGQVSETVTLKGKISDPNGRGVADSFIFVLPNMENNDQKYMIMICIEERDKTDSEGKYELQFRADGFGPIKSDFLDLYVRNAPHNLIAVRKFSRDDKEIDVTLSPGVILAGRIVDVNDNPIRDASVSLSFPSSNIACRFLLRKSCPASDENGRYEIRALWPDKQYSITAEVDGYGTASAVMDCANDSNDNKIELAPFVLKRADISVSGVVLDSDQKPIANAQVSCGGNGQPSRTTKTDSQGKFTIEKICTGSVSIHVNMTDRKLMKYFQGSIVTEGGSTDIKIIVSGRDLSDRQGPKQPPSLVGKPLPGFENIDIKFSADEIKNKATLVCFFDYQQRPSRNCVVQLAKQAKQLEEKGVAVVFIQALKVDRDTLNGWLKNQNISFPVGTIEAKEKETHLAWGVKSLPWLILTDTKHVVTSEGFSISELDKKI